MVEEWSAIADALYRTHAASLIGVAYLMCGSQAVAEDLVHDVFVAVQPRLQEIEHPGAYLRQALVNRCLRWRGRATIERERTPQPGAEGVEPAYDEILDVLWQLPTAQRVALVLRFYEDLSSEEIGRIMDIRASTVRSHLRRGLTRLKELIEQ